MRIRLHNKFYIVRHFMTSTVHEITAFSLCHSTNTNTNGRRGVNEARGARSKLHMPQSTVLFWKQRDITSRPSSGNPRKRKRRYILCVYMLQRNMQQQQKRKKRDTIMKKICMCVYNSRVWLEQGYAIPVLLPKHGIFPLPL
jgi:hypothetical protein